MYKIVEFDVYREQNVVLILYHCTLYAFGNHVATTQAPSRPFMVHAPYWGGTFGGGSTVYKYLTGVGYLIAMLTGRPVKVVLTANQAEFVYSADDMGRQHIKVGFKNDGTITAVQMDALYIYAKPPKVAIGHIACFTRVPNILMNYKAAWVNRPDGFANRSELRPNCQALDLVTNMVAAALSINPTEVALKNNGWEDNLAQQEYDILNFWAYLCLFNRTYRLRISI